MTAAEIVEAITNIVGTLVWPAFFLIVVVRFGPEIRTFIKNMSELSVKAGGLEATAKRQVAAAAALGAAEAAKPRAAGDLIGAMSTDGIAGIVATATRPDNLRTFEGSRILWVDDQPENNEYERQSLEALGIRVDAALTTDEALERLTARRYDAVISDMTRPGDDQAGYTLLDQLRARQDHTPFIIYAGSSAPEYVTEARRRGAQGSTSRPAELFELVIDALEGRR